MKNMFRDIVLNYANVGGIWLGDYMRVAGMKLNAAGVALQTRSSRAIMERAQQNGSLTEYKVGRL